MSERPLFITGIGTGVGKTLISAIVTQALKTNYWKPVQAGVSEGTDAEWVKERLSNNTSMVFKEAYQLQLPASPHIAAREEGISIAIPTLLEHFQSLPQTNLPLIIEGAGGIMVPLNEKEFVADLIKALNARVILVSRNYLGSINHSLLTATYCKAVGIDVAGWIFNDQYLHYEAEIEQWSGYPSLGSIPYAEAPDKAFVATQAMQLLPVLKSVL